jgi:hypothetical protein
MIESIDKFSNIVVIVLSDVSCIDIFNFWTAISFCVISDVRISIVGVEFGKESANQ